MIYNPYSGRGNIGSKINDILKYLKDYEVSVFHSDYEREITSYLFNNGARFDLVVLFGGDGTLNEAINGLMKIAKKPKLLYIPSGSVNDFGKFLGLKKNYKKCFKLLGGLPKKVDICKVGDEYFIYVLGCGKFTSISYDTRFYFLKRYFGRLFYYFKALKEVFKKYKFQVITTVGDKKYIGKYFLFLALNIDNVASIKINKEKSKIDDGLISLYLFKYRPFLSVLSLSMFFLFKRKSPFFIEEITINNFEMLFQDEMILNTDGEGKKYNKLLRIEVIKEAIEIYW